MSIGSLHRLVFWFAWAVLLVGAGGCGRPGPEQYVPTSDAARQALDAALMAWQAGQPAGPIEGTSPTVCLVDSHRRAGQRLQAYQVLGETYGSGPRCFTVRLTLIEPSAEQKVRFVVFGKGKLWVMRHEDFDMIAHWEHPMDEGAKDQPGSSGK